MNFRNRWTMGLLSLGAAALLGVSANAVYAQSATPEPNAIEGQQRPNRGMAFAQNHTALLAEALGIPVEELEAAQQAVQAQLIAGAVESGQITQDEADLMAARQALQAYLQERLDGVYEAAIAQAVTDGVITQEQADLLLSQEGSRGFGGPGMGSGQHSGPRGGHMGREGFDSENFGGENFGGERAEGGPDGQGRGGRGPGQPQSPLPEGTPESSSAPIVPSNNTDL